MNKIDENWDQFEHKTKIRTYLKKIDENWDQKDILTFKLYFLHKYVFYQIIVLLLKETQIVNSCDILNWGCYKN